MVPEPLTEPRRPAVPAAAEPIVWVTEATPIELAPISKVLPFSRLIAPVGSATLVPMTTLPMLMAVVPVEKALLPVSLSVPAPFLVMPQSRILFWLYANAAVGLYFVVSAYRAIRRRSTIAAAAT